MSVINRHLYGAKPRKPWQQRFWDKVIRDERGCWLWTGATNGSGYGQFHMTRSDGRRQRYAHRVAYEDRYGPIAEGMTLDHLCRNPRCVNPDHLEAVTDRVNIRRGTSPAARRARQRTCLSGHVFDQIYVDPNGRPHRKCSICVRVRNARRSRAAA